MYLYCVISEDLHSCISGLKFKRGDITGQIISVVCQQRKYSTADNVQHLKLCIWLQYMLGAQGQCLHGQTPAVKSKTGAAIAATAEGGAKVQRSNSCSACF